MQSIVVLEKPTPRVPLPDWHGKVWELRQTCDTRRTDALNLRSESKQLRNESDSRTNWDTYHNNTRIADRLVELENWRETFTSIIEAIDKELTSMAHEKGLTEGEIEFLGMNFSMVNECLTQRDQRGGADLCTDSAELEIKHELKVLESLKAMLTKKCQHAWDQMNELTQLKFRLIQDLEDKNQSIEIDTDNLGLDRYGANITNKMDATRLPSSMISYESWKDHCNYMKQKADSTLEESQKIRESMYVPRERARNDLKAQNDATNFALRKRIYETQRIKNELDWQRLNMTKDMEKLYREIDNLEKAFENKTNALKLVETRSENRLYRPGKECCRDDVAVGLEEEIITLRKTKASLESKLNQARATYNSLEEQLVIVDKELFNKNHALTTDLRCLDLRNRLSRGKDKNVPDTQTDRNIELTRMQDEIPPEN